jgi:FtsP/CotA-like multicopper oxidase with cupredoxin domain
MKTQRMPFIIGMVVAMAALIGGITICWARPITSPGSTPDYFETPNWAFSPPLTKFVDPLPVLWDPRTGGTAPAKCLSIAVPDTITYPGSDYYEIELREFTEKMHSELPPTTLRGYVQVNQGTNAAGTLNNITPAPIRYLGPLIIAKKDRPVRIKFTNAIPANSKLFLPVDKTIMGAGAFTINFDPETNDRILPLGTEITGDFSQNRATIHLHGGRTPWISDGTPHQWITPAGETTDYPKGTSVAYVPDMWFAANGSTITSCAGKTTCAVSGATNNPGPGSSTFYYTNQQSARMMFYHDHASGITRLNVYAGEVAGYLITDDAEKALVGAPNAIPADQIPLVFQDKTFVDDATIKNTDPTWAWGSQPWDGTPGAAMTPVKGDLWWPHVYMPAQNPYNPDFSGINAMGRWHYGPWFWPPTPVCGTDPQAVPPFCIKVGTITNPYYSGNSGNPQPPEIPGTPDVSWGAEAFLDTPVVNGIAFPKITVAPKAYRFRVLNGSHDRFVNLQLYLAANKTGPTTPGAGTPIFTGPVSDLTEVSMVPAVQNALFPSTWPADGREGGVPNPTTRGPAMIQIGNEGGFLPEPVLLNNQPISYNLDVTMFNVGNVLPLAEGGGTLILGPAERADIIVDFTKYAGKTLILYNDAPTAYPALDPHYDYYTGAPDRTDIGGSPAIPAGKGPNDRTVMQITVSGSGGTAPINDYNPATLTNLTNKFKSTATTKGVFSASQAPVIVGQSAYNSAYNKTFPKTWPYWGVSRISDNAISYMEPDGTYVKQFPMKPKAIHDEMGGTFDDYGRMSAKLGLEVPYANAAIATFALQNYVDPPTEITADNQVQIWKFTHNGVDTHPIHFHLFEVQVVNRVGWDGFIRLPDANELGWKETVRMSPLEDTIVALRATRPRVPFAVPDSIRPLNPAMPIDTGNTEGFSQIDTLTGGALATPTVNVLHNYGHEYVWHCHILSHEENDMMRPLAFNPNTKSKILWRNISTGVNGFWYMDGLNVTGYSNTLPTVDPVTDPGWTVVGRGDFNNDGHSDIVWRNTLTGENAFWLLDGHDKPIAYPYFLSVDPATDPGWIIAGVGDFNSDGKPDILWRNPSTGENAYWRMNGITFDGGFSLPPRSGTTWVIAGVADFNSDGKPDIIWSHTDPPYENEVWFMDGTSHIGTASLPNAPGSGWAVGAVGDFNSDIYPDILWRNYTSGQGQNLVEYMNGTTPAGGTANLTQVNDTNWIIVGF